MNGILRTILIIIVIFAVVWLACYLLPLPPQVEVAMYVLAAILILLALVRGSGRL